MFWGSTRAHTDDSKQQAVQELRSKLATTDVHKQLLAGKEPGVSSAGLDELTLTRWLAAEDWNVPKAFQRLCNHAPWRAKNFPAGRIPESDISSELAGKKSFLQGVDKQGRALSIILASKHSKSKRDLEETKRLICYCLDAAIDRCDLSKNPTGKVVAIFDLRGVPMDALDTSALHAVFDLMQNHYPERLGMLWMYEASFLFNSIWKVVSPFIDAATKAKIKFIGKEGQSELQSMVDLTVLPADVGGQAKMVPVQDAVAQMRAQSGPSHPSASQPAQMGEVSGQSQPGLSSIGKSGTPAGAPSSNQARQPAASSSSADATGNRSADTAMAAPAERLPEQVKPSVPPTSAGVPSLQKAMQDLSLQSSAPPAVAASTAPNQHLQPKSQGPLVSDPPAASAPGHPVVNKSHEDHLVHQQDDLSTGHKIMGAFGKAKDKIVHPTRA